MILFKTWKTRDLSKYGSIWHTPQILLGRKYLLLRSLWQGDVQGAGRFPLTVVLVCTLAEHRLKNTCVNCGSCHVGHRPAFLAGSPLGEVCFRAAHRSSEMQLVPSHWAHFVLVTFCFMGKGRRSPRVAWMHPFCRRPSFCKRSVYRKEGLRSQTTRKSFHSDPARTPRRCTPTCCWNPGVRQHSWSLKGAGRV